MRSGESLWSLYSVPSYLKGGIFPVNLVFQFFHAEFFHKKSLIYRALNGFGKWKVRLLPFVGHESREYDSYILWFFNCFSSARIKRFLKSYRIQDASKNAVIYLFSYDFSFFFLLLHSLFLDKTNQYFRKNFFHT